MNMLLSQIAKQINARKVTTDASFKRLSTDTRTLQPGDLFVALVGPNFNGHEFIAQAQQKGAVGALVSEEIDTDLAQLVVADTRIGLAELARLRRQQMSGLWLAVTGSSGKTTVKEMLGHIFAEAGSVEVTQGNLNNDIGVPLTIWNMQAQDVDYRVLELGANHAGEIAYTCRIGLPQIAILNNAQDAHLSGFGSQRGVVETKGEIISSLSASGQAVLNMDETSFDYWSTLAGEREIWSFSLANTQARVYAKDLQVRADASDFVLQVDAQSVAVHLPLSGQHNVANALAAAAAASAAGLSLAQISRGLANCEAYKGRLVRHQLANDVLVIDDTYNANPASVRAAIDVLAQQAGTRCLILGDLRELGDASRSLHEGLGSYAAQAGIEYLIGVGSRVAAAVSQFALEEGRYPVAVASQDEVSPYLQGLPQQQLSCLVKGSRSSRMERVVELLLQKDQ
ncbi:MAG TPA: UDP-N-acetylmuramoyl-tripeptide--D-alanyl-D-alanine ligase [Oceanospirillaceae bacterium]|nr:UDP-N-acetylmuramoyl-tripeptide--D-alanyl-D-alanine ligase [Oceanospirillaceae bacterium]